MEGAYKPASAVTGADKLSDLNAQCSDPKMLVLNDLHLIQLTDVSNGLK